jgi:hypothetical protein
VGLRRVLLRYEGDLAVEHLLDPGRVQRALPAGDGEDGDAVAEEVGGDAHRVHDAVDAEQQGDDSVYDGGGASSGLLTLTALGSSVSDGYKATLTIGVSTS